MIYIAADHGGFALKKEVEKHLDLIGIKYQDLTPEYVEGDDYPEYSFKLAQRVKESEDNLGFLFCGTGTGMIISANKVKGIRAAFGFSQYASIKAREDNNANILTFAGRKQNPEEVVRMITAFIETPFSEKERHKRRLQKIMEFEHENRD